jgi:hypothetical protein
VADHEDIHIALPKLYGAPAYARPTVAPVSRTERPFDPDELPLESAQTDEERELAQQLMARAYEESAHGEPISTNHGSHSLLRGRPFRLRALTALFRDGRDQAGQ